MEFFYIPMSTDRQKHHTIQNIFGLLMDVEELQDFVNRKRSLHNGGLKFVVFDYDDITFPRHPDFTFPSRS